jgi:hypothetical protein
MKTTATPSAVRAGTLFGQSEIDAGEALQMFAAEVGTEPTYDLWIAKRTDWVNGYVLAKPQAKGNSADQAFSRFSKRLVDAYGLTAPRSTSDAAQKKAQERAKKAQDLADQYSQYSDSQITGMLQAAYQKQAQTPTKSNSVLGELIKVAKQRAKAQEADTRDVLKAARQRLYDMARACTDIDRINAAADVLDTVNFEVTVG